MKKILIICLLFFAKHSFQAQVNIVLDSSNLPIVAMKLPFLWPPWDPIPDTPKVTVDMGIINNGYNVMNHIGDSLNGYSGKIGIEKRGSISQAFWYQQKSYGLETRDTAGNNLDTMILGMPKEHDWVLYAPYDDHSFMRNVLVYQLGREMGYWAPRTKFCELQFYDWLWQPDYRGVYVMMEKIKRNKKRVDISKLDPDDNAGDSITGGYIVAVDKNIWASDSGWTSTKDTGVFFTYKYPKGEDITAQQKNYIQQYADSFETVMQSAGFADPLTGYRRYVETNSFMDFFFVQEFTKNLDAYRRSAYLYKDKASKDGRLRAGPLWDFNSSLYNAKICSYEQDTGWAYQMPCWLTASYHIPFWWERFLQDSAYTQELNCRWQHWRSTVFDTAHIFHLMDSMANYIRSASVRHFTKYDTTQSLQPNADSLKNWIGKRLAWLDANMPGTCSNVVVNHISKSENEAQLYPNPAGSEVTITLALIAARKLQVDLLNAYGQRVKGMQPDCHTGANKIRMNIEELPAGIYFVKISGTEVNYTRKLIIE